MSISVTLGPAALQLHPLPWPTGWRPSTRGWRSPGVEGSAHPPLPQPPPGAEGRLQAALLPPHPSPPASSPSLLKSFHPRQLLEEADALLWGRGSRAGCRTAPGGGAARPPARWLPSSWLGVPAGRSPAAARVSRRSEVPARAAQPQPCPSLPPSAPPRRSSDSPAESS